MLIIINELTFIWGQFPKTLQRCHNDRDGVSITGLTIVYWTVYSRRRSKETSNSASLAFVTRIHRWAMNSPHKGPVTRKMFPFDDVIIKCPIPHKNLKTTYQNLSMGQHEWKLNCVKTSLRKTIMLHCTSCMTQTRSNEIKRRSSKYSHWTPHRGPVEEILCKTFHMTYISYIQYIFNRRMIFRFVIKLLASLPHYILHANRRYYRNEIHLQIWIWNIKWYNFVIIEAINNDILPLDIIWDSIESLIYNRH